MFRVYCFLYDFENGRVREQKLPSFLLSARDVTAEGALERARLIVDRQRKKCVHVVVFEEGATTGKIEHTFSATDE